jgi:hypothetical protein
MLNQINYPTNRSIHHADLELISDGMDIIVNPGTFRISGIDYVLKMRQRFTVQNRPVAASLTGFLVLFVENSVSEVGLFVDEVLEDGIDIPYQFTEASLVYIATLFQAKIPANASGLDNVVIDHYRYGVQA